MKRLTLLLAASALVTTPLLALDPPPGPVPDSGSAAGMLVLGLAALFAIRRKLSK